MIIAVFLLHLCLSKYEKREKHQFDLNRNRKESVGCTITSVIVIIVLTPSILLSFLLELILRKLGFIRGEESLPIATTIFALQLLFVIIAIPLILGALNYCLGNYSNKYISEKTIIYFVEFIAFCGSTLMINPIATFFMLHRDKKEKLQVIHDYRIMMNCLFLVLSLLLKALEWGDDTVDRYIVDGFFYTVECYIILEAIKK